MLWRWRRRAYQWLEPGEQAHPWENAVDLLLIVLILMSVIIVVLESMPEMAAYFPLLRSLERAIVFIFTIEYLLRLWTAPEIPGQGSGIPARIRYAIRPMALVDLAAVLPYYLELVAGPSAVVLRLLRVFRLVRVLKFGRYHASLGLLGRVLVLRRAELTISLALVLALVVIASTLMYAVEHDAQPKAFGSIPSSMWWGVVTLTTVGYGDVYPITTAGRFIAAISVILGLGLFALPAGILASGFSEELARLRQHDTPCPCCPHCGKDLPRDLLDS